MTLRYDTTAPENIEFADSICRFLQQTFDEYKDADYDEDDEDMPCNPMTTCDSIKDRFDYLLDDYIEMHVSMNDLPIKYKLLKRQRCNDFLYRKMVTDYDIINIE